MLLNAPLFKVNNSVFQERFDSRKQKIIDSGKYPPESSDTIRMYSGTSYWSTANILREGKFYINSEVVKTSLMLGSGVYVAPKVGKTAPYVGNVTYDSQKNSDPSKEQSDGIVMMLDVMKGERFVNEAYQSDIQNKFKTYLAKDATEPSMYSQTGKGLRDYEGCVKDNELLSLQYFADVSSRTFDINIKYDDLGYHNKKTGELTHDKNGIDRKSVV